MGTCYALTFVSSFTKGGRQWKELGKRVKGATVKSLAKKIKQNIAKIRTVLFFIFFFTLIVVPTGGVQGAGSKWNSQKAPAWRLGTIEKRKG